jgi:hypothetical protein
LIKKIKIKFLVVNFCSILDHQTLDPDPESGSAIGKNAGSETLGKKVSKLGSIAELRAFEFDGTTYPIPIFCLVLCYNPYVVTGSQFYNLNRCPSYLESVGDSHVYG